MGQFVVHMLVLQWWHRECCQHLCSALLFSQNMLILPDRH